MSLLQLELAEVEALHHRFTETEIRQRLAGDDASPACDFLAIAGEVTPAGDTSALLALALDRLSLARSRIAGPLLAEGGCSAEELIAACAAEHLARLLGAYWDFMSRTGIVLSPQARALASLLLHEYAECGHARPFMVIEHVRSCLRWGDDEALLAAIGQLQSASLVQQRARPAQAYELALPVRHWMIVEHDLERKWRERFPSGYTGDGGAREIVRVTRGVASLRRGEAGSTRIVAQGRRAVATQV